MCNLPLSKISFRLVILVENSLKGHLRYVVTLCCHEILDIEEAHWEEGTHDLDSEEPSSNPGIAAYVPHNWVQLLSLMEPHGASPLSPIKWKWSSLL